MSAIALETPLANTLNSVVHAKITEEGWSQEDDTSLAEYIVLMLVNGKTQDQIASELASELLQDVEGIPEFAQWLSDQVASLSNGGVSSTSNTVPSAPAAAVAPNSFLDQGSNGDESMDGGEAEIPAAYDADVGDAAPGNAPRGPKGMHGGRPAGRGGRIMGGAHRGMDRPTDPLHRIISQPGVGRINSHVRGAPRGPRNGPGREARPGMQKALNGLNLPTTGQPISNNMMQNGGQGGQPIMQITPQQQMDFMAMMEQQARMMAQMTGMVQPGMNTAFPAGGNQQQNGQGRSLFERVEAGSARGRGGRGRGRGAFQNGARNAANKTTDAGGDTTMENDVKPEEGAASTMDVDQTSSAAKDLFTTMCRWNTRCINKDCPYVHQTPAAPEGVQVDMSDTCTYGAACKNYKCTGRHPSPAQIKAHQSEQMCKFSVNCTNPTCPFKHPDMPLCRNGADCKTEGCKFTHLATACKFKPCMNTRCPFKHEEGQKGVLTNNKWTAEGAKQEDKHVSERKFVDENEVEELIRPAGEDQTLEKAENSIT